MDAQATQTFHLASGEHVVIPANSHLLVHKEDGILARLPDLLAQIDGDDADKRGFIEKVFTFDEPVGNSICVTTSDKDEITYARRLKPDGKPYYGPSRFVMNREPEPCNQIILVLKAENEEKTSYRVVTGYVGYKTHEPYDRFATPADKEFWRTHALVWGSASVLPGSHTIEIPDGFRIDSFNGFDYHPESYIALVLDEASATAIKPLAAHATCYCHHVTMAYKPSFQTWQKFRSMLGSTIEFDTCGLVKDEKGQALLVKGVESEKKFPHITLSCAEGVQASYSNDLAEAATQSGAIQPHSLTLRGTVQLIRF